MKIGSFFIGWEKLTEENRLALGLDPCQFGWEGFCVMLGDWGYLLAVRGVRSKKVAA